jgi:hypothetical protein
MPSARRAAQPDGLPNQNALNASLPNCTFEDDHRVSSRRTVMTALGQRRHFNRGAATSVCAMSGHGQMGSA